jgi:hypothetical protein
VYRRYKDRAEFVAVYVREAHPSDGWTLASNDKIGLAVSQHRTFQDRCDAAKTCCRSLKMTVPLVVDEIDNRVGIAYSGMPDRLYVIDTRGRVAYKGGRGPFGYKPSEMEQALVMLLMDEGRARPAATPPRAAEKDR